MRVFGRLALAAALLVPVGVVTASSAGASGGGFACTGAGGTTTATPGLVLFTGHPQTLASTQHALNCTGGFVTHGNLTASVQTPQSVRCSGIVGLVDRGTAKITWTSPAGFGRSTLKLNMTITGSTGHTTSGTLSGAVTTTGSNFAAGKTVSGTFVLGKGLKSTNSGGDCTVNIPLTTFPITSISLHT
jgi:hypothetical protein